VVSFAGGIIGAIALMLRGERFEIAILLPLPGLGILASARSGFIELRPDERTGVITVRSFLSAQRTRFRFGDLLGSAIRAVPPDAPRVDQEQVLMLLLSDERSVPIARAATVEAPATRKTALDGFLAEQGLPER
jgi:hypothetical protein